MRIESRNSESCIIRSKTSLIETWAKRHYETTFWFVIIRRFLVFYSSRTARLDEFVSNATRANCFLTRVRFLFIKNCSSRIILSIFLRYRRLLVDDRLLIAKKVKFVISRTIKSHFSFIVQQSSKQKLFLFYNSLIEWSKVISLL